MEKLSSTTKINRFSVSLIAQIRGALIWLPDASERKAIRAKPKAKSLFMFYHIEDKSAFRRANNEITEGLASGGALKCGEYCQALGYEVSRAYKRRFMGDYISP